MFLCLLPSIFQKYQSSITFFLKKIVLMVAAFRFFLFFLPIFKVAKRIIVRLAKNRITKFVQLRFIVLDDFKFKLPVAPKRATDTSGSFQPVSPVTFAVPYVVGVLIKGFIRFLEPKNRAKG